MARGSTNSSSPNTPFSRPMPDIPKPPNGAARWIGAPLTSTCPARRRRASARAPTDVNDAVDHASRSPAPAVRRAIDLGTREHGSGEKGGIGFPIHRA